MKEDENKMDDLLREKFSTRSFPFDEENWEKLEDKLNVVRRNQRIRKMALIFTVGLFAGIAVMIPFVNHESVNENKITAQKTETIKTPTPEVPVVNNRDTKSANQATQSKNELAATKTLAAKKNTEAKEAHHSVQPDAQKKESSGFQYIAPASKKNESASANQVKTSEAKQTESSAQPDPVVPSVKVSTPDATPPGAPTDPNTASRNTTEKNQPDQTKVNANKAGKEEMPKDTVKMTSPSSTVAENPLAISPLCQNTVKTNILSVEAGPNYGFGWKYGSASEGNGFTPVLGIGFTHFFDSKWGLYTGVRYGLIANMNVSQKTFTTTTSNFGSTHIDSTIAPKWLHYISIPLFLQYQLDEKNAICAGVTMAYLINTTSDVTVSTQSDFKPVEQTKNTSSGYIQGFNSLDASISVAYRRSITGKFSILAEMDYGLLDIKDDTFFSEQAFERSTGIKLLLSYDLFTR